MMEHNNTLSLSLAINDRFKSRSNVAEKPKSMKCLTARSFEKDYLKPNSRMSQLNHMTAGATNLLKVCSNTLLHVSDQTRVYIDYSGP